MVFKYWYKLQYLEKYLITVVEVFVTTLFTELDAQFLQLPPSLDGLRGCSVDV